MIEYEYTVVPAPVGPFEPVTRRGANDPEDRFAIEMEGLLNDMAKEGWEYQSTDILFEQFTAGLTGKRDPQMRQMMVFRRPLMDVGPEPLVRRRRSWHRGGS